MYSTYRFRTFVCKASWLSRPPGAKIHEKQHLRIQEGHFLKSALNLDLTLSDDGECLVLLISCGIIDLGAFCVELWPKQVLHRISAPMSYISLWERSKTLEDAARLQLRAALKHTAKVKTFV